jgi:hypothetical protein
MSKPSDGLDEWLIADASCLDPIYSDGLAGVWQNGTNYTTIYFRYQPVKSENGVLVFERVRILCVVRPVSSIATDIRKYEAIGLVTATPLPQLMAPLN